MKRDYYNPTPNPDYAIRCEDFTLSQMCEDAFNGLPEYLQDILSTIDADIDEGKWLEINNAIRIINECSVAWLRIGAIAQIVKQLKRYKGHFESFTDFCQKGLKRSRSYIDRLIRASKTVIELAQMGYDTLPLNESQARPLTKFTGAELADKWHEVIEVISPHLITAQVVSERVEDKQDYLYRNMKVPRKIWDEFEAKCLDEGRDPHKQAEELLKTWEPKNEQTKYGGLTDEEIAAISPEQEEKWQEDLKELASQEEIEEGENIDRLTEDGEFKLVSAEKAQELFNQARESLIYAQPVYSRRERQHRKG